MGFPDEEHVPSNENSSCDERLRQQVRLQDAVERLGKIGGWRWDVAREELYWTPGVNSIHDVEEEVFAPGSYEHISQSLACYDPPWDKRIKELFERCVATGEPYDVECPFTTKKGRHLWVRVTAQAVWAEGRIVRAEGTIQDITDRKKNEEALAKSEARWRQVLVNAPQIGLCLDGHGRIVFANEHFLRLTGWREDEVIGRSWFDLCIPEEERDDIRRVFRAVMAGGSVSGFSSHENDIVLKNGVRRTIAWSNIISEDASRRVAEVTCLGVDVTDRRLREATLSQREAFFHRLFMQSKAVMLLIDPNTGDILDANRAALHFYGYPRNILCSMRMQQLNMLPPAEVTEEMRLARKESRHFFLFPHRLASGESRFVEEYSSPIEMGKGGVIFSIFHDVSDRVKAEQALKRHADLQVALLDALQEIVTLKDLEERFLLVNKSFCHIMRLPEEEIIGRHVREVCSPELAELLLMEDRELLEGAGDKHFVRHIEIDGVPRQLDVFKTLIRDAEGNPYAILSVSHDETALLDALFTARKMAGEREVLLREVHHRVRNNLQVVASLMSMQARLTETPEAKSILQRSIHRVESMALIHEHLYQSSNFSRINMHEYLSSLVLMVMQVYQMDGVTPKYGINVQAEGVELSLEQAIPCGLLVNELLTNAFRHAFAGRTEGTIWVRCVEETREGDTLVVLSVQDDGVGLPESPPTEHLGGLLMSVLTRQLHGTLEKQAEGGMRVSVTFPKEMYGTGGDFS